MFKEGAAENLKQLLYCMSTSVSLVGGCSLSLAQLCQVLFTVALCLFVCFVNICLGLDLIFLLYKFSLLKNYFFEDGSIFFIYSLKIRILS